MATTLLPESHVAMSNGTHGTAGAAAVAVDQLDPFVENQTPQSNRTHRYSSHFDPDSLELGFGASPSQVKRTLEAHLVETEKRLQDTQKLGSSLLNQRTQLTEKIREVEKQQDEAEITPELRQRLAELEKEHNDVGKEIARALLPKSRNVSGEEKPDASMYSSQGSSSPTKAMAPGRRQRNQPANRAGDLQFAADISTSLLAQVRQLQAAVAERDEIIKRSHADQSRHEQDAAGLSQRLRTLDENEQRYKDENWNLETQNHQLMSDAREAAEREKRLNATMVAAVAEKSRMQNDMDEIRLAHGNLTDQHAAAKKAHDAELHSLKRNIDLGEEEKMALQTRLEELTAQNQELARAVTSRYRTGQSAAQFVPELDQDKDLDDLDTPEGSPPPSPSKGTPRHGGLESETLRSSLHHAHRMIQNLKGNIHREKTEKIELKRMLQEARDELEQRRNEGPGSNNKRQKPKTDTFKKPLRPDMLGGSRRSRTDVEVDEQDWEDHAVDSLSAPGQRRHLPLPGAFNERGITDVSDAYQTSTETEGPFETADEKQVTESEDFQTGAESLADDSTDDLTETEGSSMRKVRPSTIRATRPLALRTAGDRSSYMSTASTSAGEDEDDMKTPVQPQPYKFRLKNGRQSFARQSRIQEGTPDSVRTTMSTIQDSPSTVINDRSPPAAEQSLFAELGEFDDAQSDRFGTPGRASITSRGSVASADSTPYTNFTPSRRVTAAFSPEITKKASMVDSSMMTDPWEPQPSAWPLPAPVASASTDLFPETPSRNDPPSPSDFPLPPSVPVSPVRKTDTSTQYTPHRALHESPLRSTNFITPPKTVWDEAAESPRYSLDYSGMLVQDTAPVTPAKQDVTPGPELQSHKFSAILAQQTEPISPPYKVHTTEALLPRVEIEDDSSQATNKTIAGATAGGMIAAAAAAIGLTQSKKATEPQANGDNAQELVHAASADVISPEVVEEQRKELSIPTTALPVASQIPLTHVHHAITETPLTNENTTQHESYFYSPSVTRYMPTNTASTTRNQSLPTTDEIELSKAAPIAVSMNDQGSQTTLTAQQIEKAMQPKAAPALTSMPPVTPITEQPTNSNAVSNTNAFPPRRSSRPPHELHIATDNAYSSPIPGSGKRPASASSQRSISFNKEHPPLPVDHKNAIAKAGGMVTSPNREMNNNSSNAAVIMGPPAMSASAMRQQRTNTENSVRVATPASTAPRTSYAASRNARAGTTSQLSHRSSVSSFASELDERFNIRADAPPASHGFETAPGTDPRMIQAITQTMIGEFLWKYTRKTGRPSEMSDTRHRRYFWVHPYTKTLYWSEQDPQTAGRTELKAKSVAIESVRVVADDNPMPPGLHRKSLEVTTPGRKVRFTAATGQRHETWFNALSYLLAGHDGRDTSAYAPAGDEITREDIDEFNVHGNGYGATLLPSRMSMSSYNSRTTQGTSAVKGSVRQSTLPQGVTIAQVPSRTAQTQPHESVTNNVAANTSVRRSRADQPREAEKNRSLRNGSMSRISRMIGSVTGRSKSEHRPVVEEPSRRENNNGSIYNASVVEDAERDSAEELRREMIRQEKEGLNGGLENVRACCDGKHDVSMLHHQHNHSVSGKPGASRVASMMGTKSRKSTAPIPTTAVTAGPSA